MTEEELIEIEARCNAATPGPWETKPSATGNPDTGIIAVIHGKRHVMAEVYAQVDGYGYDKGRSFLDGTFIASARSDVPALVAEVRRLRAELATVMGAWETYPNLDIERLEDGRYEAAAFEGKDPLGNRNAWAIGATPLEAVRALAVQWERVK